MIWLEKYFWNFAKKALMLLLVIFIFTPYYTQAKDNTVFINPEKPGKILTKNTEENIRGYILTNNEIDKGEISFDGQIWRDLRLSRENDRYNFNYIWTVAGKGKMFIMVKFLYKDNLVAEGKILAEVYVPPELKEVGLLEMLGDYQEKQEKEQAKLKNQTATSPSALFIMENFFETTIGNFIDQKWMAFLPSKVQYESMMQGTYFLYDSINKYPAGIDIFFFFTVPVMLIIAILMFVFIIIEYGQVFIEYLSYLISNIFLKNKNSNLIGVVFDIDDQSVVKWAKIIFLNNQTHQKYIRYSNEQGIVYFGNMPQGEYNYESIKNGYKNYIVKDIENIKFLSKPIAINNSVNITEIDTQIALPIESEISIERKIVFEKKRLLYKIKKIFIYNFELMTGIGSAIASLWMIFVDPKIAVGLIGYMLINQFIYRTVIRQQKYTGQIFDQDIKPKSFIKLSIFRNNIFYVNVWTDIWGKFLIGNLEEGVYNIKLSNQFIYLSKHGYYQGQDWNNSIQNMDLPIKAIIGK